mgnify:CR=1 FL=1
MLGFVATYTDDDVAPPRGERGLKYVQLDVTAPLYWSLPLVGSVD